MLQALAEADAAQQLGPEIPRIDTDHPTELPLLPPEMMERVVMTPVTPMDSSTELPVEPREQAPTENVDQDVTMTQ